MSEPRICTDVAPKVSLLEAAEAAIEETRENLPRLLIPGTPLGNTSLDDRQAAAMLTGKKWANGRRLRVAFMGGDGRVIDRVVKYVREIGRYVNLTFVVSDDPDSEIRVAFAEGQGSWSYLGTDSLGRPKGEPTMNYGWLEPDTREDEYARVVQHEFCHAVGLIHEHQNPKASIPWDKEAVYRHYAGPPNRWDRATVDRNIFRRYSTGETNFTAFDRNSIMLYAIPNSLTVGDFEVGWNRALSENDKAFLRAQYPKATEPAKPAPAYRPGVPRAAVSKFDGERGEHFERIEVLVAQKRNEKGRYYGPAEEIGVYIPKALDEEGGGRD